MPARAHSDSQAPNDPFDSTGVPHVWPHVFFHRQRSVPDPNDIGLRTIRVLCVQPSRPPLIRKNELDVPDLCRLKVRFVQRSPEAFHQVARPW